MHAVNIEPIARELSVRSYLATTDERGEPHVVPVHPAWVGTTIWVMTASSAVKSRNIRTNPQVAMHWETNDVGDGLLVWGTAEVHSDIETKTRLWSGVFDYDLDSFAPNGPSSPDVSFLSIEPNRAVHALAYGAGGVQRWRKQPV